MSPCSKLRRRVLFCCTGVWSEFIPESCAANETVSRQRTCGGTVQTETKLCGNGRFRAGICFHLKAVLPPSVSQETVTGTFAFLQIFPLGAAIPGASGQNAAPKLELAFISRLVATTHAISLKLKNARRLKTDSCVTPGLNAPYTLKPDSAISLRKALPTL